MICGWTLAHLLDDVGSKGGVLSSAPGRLPAGTLHGALSMALPLPSPVPCSCCWEAGAVAELPGAAAAMRPRRLAALVELGLLLHEPVLGAQDSRSQCEGWLARLPVIKGETPVLGARPKHPPQQGAKRRRRLVQQPRCLRCLPGWALRPLVPAGLAGAGGGGPAGLPAWGWQGCTRAAAAGSPAVALPVVAFEVSLKGRGSPAPLGSCAGGSAVLLASAPLLGRGSTLPLLLYSAVGCSAALLLFALLVPRGACLCLSPPSGSSAHSQTDSSSSCSAEVTAQSEWAPCELAPSSLTTASGALLPSWGLQAPSAPSGSRVSHVWPG